MKKTCLLITSICLILFWPAGMIVEMKPETSKPILIALETEGPNLDPAADSAPDNTGNSPVSSSGDGQASSNSNQPQSTSKPVPPNSQSGEKTNQLENTPSVSAVPEITPEPLTENLTDNQNQKNELATWAVYFSQVSNWWTETPLNQQLWYLFCLAGLMLYLFKLRRLRKPFLMFSLIVLGFYLKGQPDPIGGIFDFLIPGALGTLMLILLAIPIFLSLIWGRIFCGWICPLGALQEFLHPEGARLIPSRSDKVLKYLKYPVLLIFVFLTWRAADNVWNLYQPFNALFNFSASFLIWMILALIIFLSMMVERAFCRYLCPLGAILAITSRISPFRMRSDPQGCMICGKCTNGDCPMNAIDSYNPYTDSPFIDNQECLKCLYCQNVCHRDVLRITGYRLDPQQRSRNANPPV